MALTAKQAAFVQEYLIDLNATQAAIRAGYSKKRADAIGYENLRKPEIAEAITAAMQEREQRTQITQDMVLKELAKIGFSDIRRAVRWSSEPIQSNDEPETELEPQPHGGALRRDRVPHINVVALVDSDCLDDDTAAAIAEISQGRDGMKVKLHDKKGALVDIGRHLGMFKDRVEHSGPNGGPIETVSLSPEQAERIAREFLIARKQRG